MDLNLLTTFEAVARTNSFSAAAKELRLPKSSVSRGIARLEADLGVQLVFRTTRQVSLSAAGTALYDRLSPLLRSVKAALGAMPEREELPSGTLRVTAPVDLGVLFLAEVVTRYTARYPSVSVDLHLTGRVVDLVGEGFDVALRVAASLKDSTLVARRALPIVSQVYGSPLYLARKGTPRSEADLAAHEWVIFRPGPQRIRVPAPSASGGAPPHGRIVCDDILFVRDAVRAGAGLALLPSFMAEADVLAGRLVRVVPRYERQSGWLHIVTPAVQHVPLKVTAFRELVLEMLRTTRAAAPA
jgi:DNA-binding transcriptional LysR family regulator